MIVLAVHGYPLDHRMWQPLGALVSEGALGAPARLVAPDLRGRGRSRLPALEVHTMARLAEDMAAEIAALPREEPLVLVGLSMGGYVLFELLRRHGADLARRLRAVVLCDTRATPDDEAARAGRKKAIADIREKGIAAARDAMLPKLLASAHGESALPALVERMILETPPDTARADLAGMAERVDGFTALSGLEVPLLCVVGLEDVITPPECSDEMALAANPAARPRVVRIPGAGHVAPLEAPHAVARAMSEFLFG